MDHDTGFSFDLSADAVAVLKDLPAGPAETLDPEVRDFLALLDASGLLAGPSAEEARARQARLLRHQADERQWPRLREALERAATHTRFHRRFLPLLSADAGPALLAQLPLMGREDVRREFPDGLVPDDVNLAERIEQTDFVFATTSGTAGERLQVLSDTTLPRYPHDFEAWWGLPPLPPGQVPRSGVFTSAICAGPVCHLGRATMAERTFAEYTVFLNSTEDLFGLDEALARNVLEEIAAFRADLLFVNPVYLAVLVRKAQALGLPLPRPRVVVSCYQMLTARHRQLLREALGCPVIDYFSATELGGSIAAMECGRGVMHAWPDRVRIEVLDAEGRPRDDDGIGHLAVTTLNPSMPLVRYVVGDLGRFVNTACPCAKGGEWPALRIEGRGKSAFVLGERVVTPRAVDDAVAALPVDFYRLEQRAQGFRLEVIPEPGAGAPTAAALEPVEALLGQRVELAVTHRFRPERSQKYPTTVPLGPGAVLDVSRGFP